MKKLYSTVLFLLLLAVNAGAQTKRYVKPGGTGDGSSWANASANLQAMINASAANDEVWVAAGTYTPTEKIDASGGPRDVSFILKAGVKIYGGLADGATDLATRNFIANTSILSGDLGGAGKAYHVVASKSSSGNAVLDGFTIQDGLADGSAALVGIERNQGGAINITDELTNAVFSNLVIRNNQSSGTGNGGGAVFLSLRATSDCVFDRTIFDTNESVGASGGGIYFSAIGAAKLTLRNSKVAACKATGGAGIYAVGTVNNIAQLNVLNSIFYQNHGTNTSSTAGAIYIAAYADASIVHCTFYANISAFGAVSFYNNGSTANINIYNSIFNANRKSNSNAAAADVKAKNLANLSLRYNLLQQEYSGYSNVPTNNLIVDADPANLFVSTAVADANFLKLVEGAATEKGSNNYATNFGLTTDLAGESRLKHTNVDLGAYEYQGTLPVELENFTAKRVKANVQLQWKVASEVNNEKFRVERSADLKSFEQLTELSSKGDTQSAVFYNYTDYSPLKGDNYYRLSQIDKDGTLKILGTQVVNVDLVIMQVLAYPNPAKDFIKLKLNEEQNSAVNVKLVSLLGQTLLTKRFDASANAEMLLDIARVGAGSYLLLIEMQQKTYPFNIIVAK
jgi:hypothetical protein